MARVTQRVNVKRAKSTNYTPMGAWDSSIQYRLSDMGIPLVTLEKNTVTGFAAYGLNVDKSTIGVSPDSTAGAQEWRLLESTDFLYMIQAYIEKLQAQVITAEYIEALNIRTSNLEVLNGSILGGFSIKGNNLVSQSGKVEINGLTGEISVKDPDSDAVRTIIRSTNLPASPASFFQSTGSSNVSIAGLGGVNITTNKSVAIKTIATGDSNSYQLAVPSVRLRAYAQSIGNPNNGMAHLTTTRVSLDLYKDGISQWSFGSVSEMGDSNGTISNRFIDTDAATVTLSGNGVWTLRVVISTITPPNNNGWTGSGFADVSVDTSTAVLSQVVDRSEIGSNGMVIATSAQNYVYMVGGLHEIRRGNIGFQVTENGIKKSSNMNYSSPTWSNI